MKDMVTRCPKCGTSFRITQAQLQTAKGSVRCGSCLQIFKAIDSLIDTSHITEKVSSTNPNLRTSNISAKKTKVAAKADTVKTGRKPTTSATLSSTSNRKKAAKEGLDFDQDAIDKESKTTQTDDDFLISDDMDNQLKDQNRPADKNEIDDTLSDSFLELDSWKPESSSLFDREVDISKSEENDTADESWATNLLEELEIQDSKSASIQSTPSDKDDNDDFAIFADDDDFEIKPTKAKTKTKTKAKTKPKAKTKEKAKTKTKAKAKVKKKQEPSFGAIDDFDAFVEQFDNDSQPLHAVSHGRAALLNRIEPAPVEMAWGGGQANKLKKWLWSSLTGAAFALLIIQIAAIQFDQLSRIPPYRAWYGAFCSLFGCRLPDRIDHHQIRAYNLVVRSHPRVKNALVVDTILLNTARFSQPFPNLLLSFSTLRGKLLSARKFTSAEYLGGEMAGQTHMPSEQPVHLSLEIVDPGSAAVNYSIDITE